MGITSRYQGKEVFLREPRGFASGDDVDLADRSCLFAGLTSGEQAKAREESSSRGGISIFPATFQR